MDISEKPPPVEPPPYTEQLGNKPQPCCTDQPGYTAQPGNHPQPGYTAQPGNHPQPGDTAQLGNHPQPGYTAQPGNHPQPGDTAQPGSHPQPGYTAQPGNQPQPGYTAQPDQQPQPGYPPQYGYPPPQTFQQLQQSTTVVSVGMPATQAVILPADSRPQNWLGLSIFSCLCCCWPIGLVAITYSRMVDSAYESGDYAGALRNANIAKRLNVAAILCGIVLIAIIFANRIAVSS